MSDKEKIVNMCGPDEEGIVVLQDCMHDWTDCLRRAFPEYKDMSYAEIADRIRVSRRRFFQILGLKLKPKNRIGKRMNVPKEMVEALIGLHDRIAAGEEEMKLQMTTAETEKLISLIKSIQKAVLRKFRKTLSVNEIERQAGIENLRLVNVLKPSTREGENPRYLSTHEIQRISALRDMIEKGQLLFTDQSNFQSGRDHDAFKLVVTDDDVRMIRWLQANSHFTDRGLEEVLELPAGKITQIKAEVHRENPRLNCEVLLNLVTLVEMKIEEMKAAYRRANEALDEAADEDEESAEFERLEELEVALAEIKPIRPSMRELKSAVRMEIRRKHDEAA